MDKFTVLREDLDAMAEAGLSDEEIGLTLLAMVRYGMDGQDPELTGSARVAFCMLKKRMDKYIRKCETNIANGQTGGRPPKGETKPNETQPKPNENPTETQPNPPETYDYDYEQEKDEGEDKGDREGVTPDAETHTTNHRREGRARARAREGWFDPADPGGADDEAWRYSDAARKAIAQRIITHVGAKLWQQHRYTDAGILGTELFAALEAAMREGIPPGELVNMASGCLATWVWEATIKDAVISQGGTANYPDWVAQLDDIRQEMQEIRGDQRAYG